MRHAHVGERGGINLYGFVRNSPTRRVDPKGLFASNVHFNISFDVVMGFTEFSRSDRWDIINQSWMYDLQGTQGTDADTTAGHAMAGIDPNTGEYESKEQAEAAYNKFLSDQLLDALTADDRCKRNKALGSALHAIQDHRANGHRNFSPWDGGGFMGFPGWGQLWNDVFPNNTLYDWAAYDSQQFIKDYLELKDLLDGE